MEELWVYPVQQSPDAALAHLQRGLRERGYSTRAGSTYDLVARRGFSRLFVGIAPHPDGLVARVKAKALLPGRAARQMEQARDLLSERLGPAKLRTTDPWEGRR